LKLPDAAFIFTNAAAQNKKQVDPKIFYQENFKTSALPAGCYFPTVGKSNGEEQISILN